jgi:hypothetical protein
MENQINILNTRNAYLRQFQIAQLNLAMVLEEERINKPMKINKKKTRTHD